MPALCSSLLLHHFLLAILSPSPLLSSAASGTFQLQSAASTWDILVDYFKRAQQGLCYLAGTYKVVSPGLRNCPQAWTS